MSEVLRCWKCGASLEALSLPLARADSCRSCRAELHVCRQCRFYDPTKARSCAEPVADEVRDKERANFCGYFTPSAAAWRPAGDAAARARGQLEDLFGPRK